MTFGMTARMAKGSGDLPANVTSLGRDGEASAPSFCPQLSKSAGLSTSSGPVLGSSVISAGAVAFSWSDASSNTALGGGTDAANVSTGLCSPTGLRFALPLKAAASSVQDGAPGFTLTLWAGVMGGTLTVNASIGGEVVYAEMLVAAPSDYSGNILRSNRWVIHVPSSVVAANAASEVLVDFAVETPYIPPPPPPPPAPPPLPACASALCLDLSSTCAAGTCHEVGLDWPWIGGANPHWSQHTSLGVSYVLVC